MSRRDFVTIATLSAVAATFTACGGGAEAGVSGPVLPGVPAPVPVPPVSGPTIVKLSDYPALKVVGGVAKVLNTPPVAVARTATSTYVAFSLACTTTSPGPAAATGVSTATMTWPNASMLSAPFVAAWVGNLSAEGRVVMDHGGRSGGNIDNVFPVFCPCSLC